MKKETEEQINEWLKKLERESWQLELLVSAFTIFLLISAQQSFSDYITGLQYDYYGNIRFLIFFLGLILASIVALTVFLVLHLLLRGFWIGAIGLRSVQPKIDFERLSYSEFFRKKLQGKLIGLDRLVVILDELCSIIFSVSFLIIFMIISFGLFVIFLMSVGGLISFFIRLGDLEFEGPVYYVGIGILQIIFVTGVIYLIDYFSLGFFKRYNRLSRLYYPIYRFYSAITLSFISRSIYYNLISKYSKKSIRLLFVSILGFLFLISLAKFDQYSFYPAGESDQELFNNYYDDLRSDDEYVDKVSVNSKFVDTDYVSVFIRYNPRDNADIQSNCPQFKPLKNDGINPTTKFVFDRGLSILREVFEEEDKEALLHCLSAFYEVSVNDVVYDDLSYYFYRHPNKDQRGIITMLPTEQFGPGENVILIRKKYIESSDSTVTKEDFARVPVWLVNRSE